MRNNTKSIVFSQSGLVFVVKILGLVVGFGVNYVLANIYGSSVLGGYALLTTIVTLGSTLATYGLDTGLMRYLPVHRTAEDTRGRLVSFSILIAGVFGMVLFCIIMFGRNHIQKVLFQNEISEVLLVVGLSVVVVESWTKIIGGVFRSEKRAAEYYCQSNLLYRVIFFTGLLSCALWENRVLSTVISIYLLVKILILSTLLFRTKSLDTPVTSMHYIKELIYNRGHINRLFSYSSSVFLMGVLNVVLAKTDILMLGYFMSTEKVGIYKIALVLSAPLLLFLSSINSIIPSVISDLYSKGDYEEIKSVYSISTKWITTFTLPGFITLFVFSTDILHFFGKSYVSAYIPLIILAGGNFLRATVGSNGYLLNMTGYHKTELINLVGMSMCNIALNLWLIPQFGMIGAAIATSTSIAMVNVLKVLEVHYIIGVWPFSLEWWFLGPGAILTWVIARFVRSKEPNIIGAIIALLFVFGLILAIAFVVRSETDEQIINRIKR